LLVTFFQGVAWLGPQLRTTFSPARLLARRDVQLARDEGLPILFISR